MKTPRSMTVVKHSVVPKQNIDKLGAVNYFVNPMSRSTIVIAIMIRLFNVSRQAPSYFADVISKLTSEKLKTVQGLR